MPLTHPRRLARAALAGLALCLAAACAGGDEPASAPPSAPTAQPTATAPTVPTATRFSGTDGRALYGQACAVCHGPTLEGTNVGPPFLHDYYRPNHHADIAFMFAVRRGVIAHHWSFGNMPPVEGLTDEQVLAIIAFIREEQRAAGFD